MTDTGLRQAKRRATSHALARSAFDLAVEVGVDGFTIDDVVRRAGYSRRTFANHFSGKEEAIAAVALEQVRHGLETFPEQPAELSLIDWLAALARHQLSEGMFTTMVRLKELAREHPGLEAHLSDVQREMRVLAREALVARAGDTVPEIYTHVLVGAAYGALMSVLDGRIPVRLVEGPDAGPAGSVTVPDFVKVVFTHLRSGF